MSTPASMAVSNSTLASQSGRGRAGAVVMGADYRGLGVVRSLGRYGIPVWVLEQDGQLLATTSRYTCRSLSWPAGNDGTRVDFLLDLAVKHGLKGWLLIPTDDVSVTLVARHHKSLAGQFQLTTPPWDALRWAVDKRLMHRLAHDLAIDQPWTFCPRTVEELASLDCPFPLILKPALKEEFNRLTVAKGWRADNHQSLLAHYIEASALVDPGVLMVQELVPGLGEAHFSFAALCQDGRPLASVIARRTRQFPMDLGRASTYVETVDEPGVIEPSVRLLTALHLTGLVEIEFKRDPRDGVFKLLDINPRVWGWHSLCGRAGVDFPYLLWRLIQGERLQELRGRAGLRWMRMSTDFPVVILEILRGRLSLREYVRSLLGPVESAIFAPDDPWPGLLELPLLAYLVGRRILRADPI